LVTGLYQPISALVQADAHDVHVSRDGWWTWTREGVIYLRDPDAEFAVSVGEGMSPDFMGDTLIFVSTSGDAVMKMPRDQSGLITSIYQLPAEQIARDELTVIVGPLEE
jgi:hypothetical protein